VGNLYISGRVNAHTARVVWWLVHYNLQCYCRRNQISAMTTTMFLTSPNEWSSARITKAESLVTFFCIYCCIYSFFCSLVQYFAYDLMRITINITITATTTTTTVDPQSYNSHWRSDGWFVTARWRGNGVGSTKNNNHHFIRYTGQTCKTNEPVSLWNNDEI